MNLKEELIEYYQERESNFGTEEMNNVLEILEDYNEELEGLNKTDKTLLLRLLEGGDELYEKVDNIEIPDLDDIDVFE